MSCFNMEESEFQSFTDLTIKNYYETLNTSSTSMEGYFCSIQLTHLITSANHESPVQCGISQMTWA